MIHKIVFWKPGPSGTASTDSLYFYFVLVSDIPRSWNHPDKKGVSMLPLGNDAPQPAHLSDFVEAADDLAALNWARVTLAGLPGLKEQQVQTSWVAK